MKGSWSFRGDALVASVGLLPVGELDWPNIEAVSLFREFANSSPFSYFDSNDSTSCLPLSVLRLLAVVNQALILVFLSFEFFQ